MSDLSISQQASHEQNRGRSTIKFPYSDLDDSIELVRTVYSRAGERCSFSQLSAYLGYNNLKSGAFRLRVSSAKLFGLVAIEGGHIRLETLGRQIIDPKTAAAAKKAAFLHVPLFKRLFERYEGYLLPPDVGLEREIINLGVTEKQVAKARQTFQRSAEQAGFFVEGRDRLVTPSGPPALRTMPLDKDGPENMEDQKVHDQSTVPTRGGIESLHPLVRALVESIPGPNEPWQQEKRDQWLKAAENIFRLVYGD